MTAASRLIGATLVIACASGVAACGGDNGKSAAASAAVSQTFLNVSAPGEKMTSSQAACFGSGVINAFGIDQAVKYGFLTKADKPEKTLTLTLPSKDANTYADLYLKCADPRPAIKTALIGRIAPKTPAQEQALKSCLDRSLTSSLMRKALAAGASGDDANATLTPIFTACSRLG